MPTHQFSWLLQTLGAPKARSSENQYHNGLSAPLSVQHGACAVCSTVGITSTTGSTPPPPPTISPSARCKHAPLIFIQAYATKEFYVSDTSKESLEIADRADLHLNGDLANVKGTDTSGQAL